jgi:hypothetical protein
VIYTPATPTKENVEVTLNFNESIQLPEGRTAVDADTITKSFSGNTDEGFTFYDLVGNQGQT